MWSRCETVASAIMFLDEQPNLKPLLWVTSITTRSKRENESSRLKKLLAAYHAELEHSLLLFCFAHSNQCKLPQPEPSPISNFTAVIVSVAVPPFKDPGFNDQTDSKGTEQRPRADLKLLNTTPTPDHTEHYEPAANHEPG